MLAVFQTAGALEIKMTFNGTILELKNSTILNFKCETNAMFDGCTVNFLKNYRSELSIRYDYYKCYQSSITAGGQCEPDKCACSSCHTFFWNYTVISDSDIENTTFECEGKIFENQMRFEASAVLHFSKKVFTNRTPNIKEYGRKKPFQEFSLIINSTSTIKPTLKRHGSYEFEINHVIWGILALVAVGVLILVAYFIHHMKTSKKASQKEKDKKTGQNGQETTNN